MSLWPRFKRMVRSWVGALVGSDPGAEPGQEDPMSELRDRLPQINTALAGAKGQLLRLQREQQELELRIARLGDRVRAVLNDSGGGDAAALPLAAELKRLKEERVFQEQRILQAQASCARIERNREEFLQEWKLRGQDAPAAVSGADAALLDPALAGSPPGLQSAGLDATHEEMLERLREQNAQVEGALALGQQGLEAETRYEKMRKEHEPGGVKEILDEFKAELGIGKERPLPLDPLPRPAQEQPGKKEGEAPEG